MTSAPERISFPLETASVALASADTISVTVKRACAITGLSHTTIYKLIGLGKLRSVKIGRRTLISYNSLRGLLDDA